MLVPVLTAGEKMGLPEFLIITKLCFDALWNGEDQFSKKEFWLNWEEGNGEDVKEYYFYLDNTPTHSYMKCLYKYPMQLFLCPLVENSNRDHNGPEFELIDTGIFDNDRYFDVFVEYAKIH